MKLNPKKSHGHGEGCTSMTVYVTLDEKSLVARAAAKQGLSISRWFRNHLPSILTKKTK